MLEFARKVLHPIVVNATALGWAKGFDKDPSDHIHGDVKSAPDKKEWLVIDTRNTKGHKFSTYFELKRQGPRMELTPLEFDNQYVAGLDSDSLLHDLEKRFSLGGATKDGK